MKIIIKGRLHVRLPVLVRCGQLCPIPNQIVDYLIIKISGRNHVTCSLLLNEGVKNFRKKSGGEG